MGSASFGYTGGWQSLNVPTGVSSINVTMYAGAGYGNSNAGRIIGTIHVADTDTLYLLVGGQGTNGVGGGSGSHTNTGGTGGYGAGGYGGNGYNANAGDGGGGYSCIRVNSTAGTIKCVAGGGGGDSGDNGQGGLGGGSTGGSGARGTAGSGATSAATGGSQSNPGQGGTSSSGSSFFGADGSSSVLGRAGVGGDTGGFDGPGGGGGGGGYYSGGGGSGGSTGWAPGGGGGGGSSYTGGMASVSTNDHGGGASSGNITLTWTDPDEPPAKPALITPNTSGVRSLSTGSYAVSASVSAPPLGSTSTRVLFRYDNDPAFGSYTDVYSAYRSTSGTCTATLTGLALNTRYYLRAYAQGTNGLYSTSYDTADFYTDYQPNLPTSVIPANNTSTQSTGSLAVSCIVSDPDVTTVRALFRISTNNFATYTDFYSGYVASGARAGVTLTGLAINTQYAMNVYAQDPQGVYSSTATRVNFWTNRTPTAPTLVAPPNNGAFDNTVAQPFSWTFNDPDTGDSQTQATMRYRVLDTTQQLPWTNISLTTATSTTIAANTFVDNTQYEWQVQTTDEGGLTGPFSLSSVFSGSPPVVNMGASAAMSIAATDIISPVSTMSAQSTMLVDALQSESGTVAMGANASVSIAPQKTLAQDLPVTVRATMLLNGAHITTGLIHMGAVAAVSVDGQKSVPGSVSLGANGGLIFQFVSADVIIQANAGMSVLANAITNQGTVAMGARASVALSTIEIEHPVSLPMTAAGGMTVNSLVTTRAIVGMVARASVSDSAVISHITPTLLSGRAKMTVEGDLGHQFAATLSARSAMSVNGLGNHHGALAMAAQGGMSIDGLNAIDSGGVGMSASGSMTIDGYRSFTGTVGMGASAGIVFDQTVFTFDPPYLTDTDSQGDTIIFTRDSTPIPSKVTNTLTVTSAGMVTP